MLAPFPIEKYVFFPPISIKKKKKYSVRGRVVQLVTCLTTDKCLAADQGVASLILAWSHTFLEIDHDIISMVFLPLPLIREGLSVTSESMCSKYWLTA